MSDASVLVLASASPRRREILETLGVRHEVSPSGASEVERADEAPAGLVRRLACDKAREVSRRMPGRFVLGADTIVTLEGAVLGKPADDEHARAMIRRLAGRWHEVLTGIALLKDGALLEALHVTTRVHVVAMDEARIARYVATGEGHDKAGAYAVQGIASGLCDRIEGSYSNVVGLPAMETVALLERHGALTEWP